MSSIVHFSIPVKDLKQSADFYGKLFNWKFQEMTPTYWMQIGGPGALSLEQEEISGTMPIIYFGVSNIDESLKAIRSLNAELILNKTDRGDGKSFLLRSKILTEM